MKTRMRITLSDPHPHMGQLLSSYQDGLTTPDETATVERHIAECVRCREFLSGLHQVREAISGLPAGEVDSGQVRARLSAVLSRTVFARDGRIPRPKWRLPAAPRPEKLRRPPGLHPFWSAEERSEEVQQEPGR
jgi:anti-sigma factor RsiW